MSLTPGSRLGPYEIIALLGEGGMGQVYRGRDARLNRDVALKVLPDMLARDPERLARLHREAQVLASLNHPNIAALYGFEDSDATHALVMELVEGPTLAERIEGHRAKGGGQAGLPIDEALAIAKQIAEALETAHEQNIVHRDLKPANIKVRDDGTVKVLDFGLAKAFGPDVASGPPGLSLSPTLTVQATMRGTILGTAAYMSPEQARGKAVDKRTDVWAFGCVLYEMLTGRQCFDAGGDSVSDAIAAILKNEPDWTALPAETPAYVRTLLKRCLQKDMSRRLPHIGIARLDISEPPAENAPAVAPVAAVASPARSRAAAIAWTVAALFMAAAGVLAAVLYMAPPPPLERTVRFDLTPPTGWRLQSASTPNGGGAQPLAVSPDGTKLAMVLVNADGKFALWIRALDAFTATMLAGTEGAEAPFWSPDGQFIGFFADAKLKRIAVGGGPPLVLCDAPVHRSGTWSPDGTIVFSNYTDTLWKVSQAGGVPARASVPEKGDAIHLRPTFLPDGRHFYYRLTNGGGYIGSLDEPGRRLLFEKPDASNVVFSRGHVLFLRGTTLMAQPFDEKSLTVSGEPAPVADQIVVMATPLVGVFAASPSGTLVYQAGNDSGNNTRLAWFDRGGKKLSTLGDPAVYSDVRLSPDGKRAAVGVGGPGGTDLWIFDLARGIRSKFTFDAANDVAPVWSPDGERIVFASRRKQRGDLYVKASSGAGTDEVLLADDRDKLPIDWSPDGRHLLFQVAGGATRADLWVLPLFGDKKPFPFLQTQFAELVGDFAPDGRWIAYTSDESGSNQVYVAPFPGPGGKWQISPGQGIQPRWSRGGKELLFIAPGGVVFAVSVDGTGTAFQVGETRELVTTNIVGQRSVYDVLPDGQRLLINGRDEVTASGEVPFSVVVNWAAGLEGGREP